LHLARVAAQLAGDAVGLNVEDDDNAIVLPSLVAIWKDSEEMGAYPARGEQIAAMAETN
jgi:hypothetical protein